MVIGDIWGILTGDFALIVVAVLTAIVTFVFIRKQMGKAVHREVISIARL